MTAASCHKLLQRSSTAILPGIYLSTCACCRSSCEYRMLSAQCACAVPMTSAVRWACPGRRLESNEKTPGCSGWRRPLVNGCAPMTSSSCLKTMNCSSSSSIKVVSKLSYSSKQSLCSGPAALTKPMTQSKNKINSF